MSRQFAVGTWVKRTLLRIALVLAVFLGRRDRFIQHYAGTVFGRDG